MKLTVTINKTINNRCVFILLQVFFLSFGSVVWAQEIWAQEQEQWRDHQICSKDTRFLRPYCFELLEYQPDQNTLAVAEKKKEVVLLIPGILQKKEAFDLLPEENISFARYLERKFNVQVFVLHMRGVGSSDFLSQSNIDDLAIDDVSEALEFLFRYTKKRPIVLGHSLGSIVMQGYLGGITRCGIERNCFNRALARARALGIKGVGLIAGSPQLKLDANGSSSIFAKLAKVARSKPLSTTLTLWDQIEIARLARLVSPSEFLKIWENLYNPSNVSAAAHRQLLNSSLASTSGAIVNQLCADFGEGAIKTRSGESYLVALENNFAKTYQVAMELDTLFSPTIMEETFKLFPAKHKKFEIIKNQGHIDFYLNEKLHSSLDAMLSFLL